MYLVFVVLVVILLVILCPLLSSEQDSLIFLMQAWQRVLLLKCLKYYLYNKIEKRDYSSTLNVIKEKRKLVENVLLDDMSYNR